MLLTGLYREWVFPLFLQGQGWAQAPKPVTFTNQPLPSPPEPQETWGCWWHSSAPPPAQNTYCEYFKYRRRGKGKKRIKKKGRETHRHELNLYVERAGRHPGEKRSSRVTWASSNPPPSTIEHVRNWTLLGQDSECLGTNKVNSWEKSLPESSLNCYLGWRCEQMTNPTSPHITNGSRDPVERQWSN